MEGLEESKKAAEWLGVNHKVLYKDLRNMGFNILYVGNVLNEYVEYKNSQGKIKPSEPLSPPAIYKDTSTP